MLGKSIITRNVRHELKPVELYARTVIGLLTVISFLTVITLVILVVKH